MSQPSDLPEAERIAESALRLSPAAVRTFLIENPEFLASDTELLASLASGSQAENSNVVDMRHFVIGRLQGQIRKLRDIQSDLIEASSLNSLAREKVHAAALAMLDARNFEHLIDYVASPDGLPSLLGISAATICIEADNGLSGIGLHGIRLLEKGGVARILGGDLSYRLVANVEGSRTLYGAEAPHVRSEALIRLDFSPAAPPGLLVLGGHSDEQFHPEQGADLLEFLASVVERCICRWLDLPPHP